MSVPLTALFALLPLLPAALAWTPAARWGHEAVYVKSQDSMYIIGGQVQTPGTQVTNDVLMLPLNGTNPQWMVGPSVNLPPHAFASVAVTTDGNNIVVVGGMTSNCDTDSIAHTLNVHGDGSWTHASPTGLVRRRGTGLGVINDYSTYGKLLLVGGVADQYSCGSYTTTFPAANVLTLPLSASSVESTLDLPGDLTGSTLAVSDFAMTSSADGKKMYLVSGQSSAGALASLDNIGVWTKDGGWKNQKVGGNIPVGRVGASLVAHPTLDLLVLHGGARDDRGTDLSTSLLALLNTTSWQWTIPSSLQPPQSAAASYHSSIMTPNGVMISAFGLSGTGSPRSDVHYLDMRGPASAWTWKGAWKNDMLAAYVAPSTDSTQTSGTGANAAGAAPPNTAMGAPSRKLASIVAPAVILGTIAIAILAFFVRRKMRINRKRRMARHFSFSLQEDGGDFRTPLTGSGTRRIGGGRTLYPFGGRDANEKTTTLYDDVKGYAAGFVDRLRGRSHPDREMRQVEKSRTASGKYNEKTMKWEEIDFGLGEVDSRRGSAVAGFQPSSRRSSFSATGSPPDAGSGVRYVDNVPIPVPMPMASGVAYSGQMFNLPGQPDVPAPLLVTISSATNESPRVGTPSWDGQQPLIPSLVVMPPTVPPTPAVTGDGMPEPVFPFDARPALPSTPPSRPQRDDHTAADLDWNMLEQELDSRPAFRSISPTSPLRSHQASHQTITPPRINTHSAVANPFSDRHAAALTSSPRSASPSSPAPAIPPLDFQTPPSAPAQATTVTYVNPKTGRRTSETLPLTPPRAQSPSASPMPYTPGTHQSPGSRSVSSPMQMQGRQLAGNFNSQYHSSPSAGERRGSLPQAYHTAPSSPAGPTPGGTPVVSTAVRFDPNARRGSTPTVLFSSPMGRTGSGMGVAGERRGSQLRVCNPTEDEQGPGQAI